MPDPIPPEDSGQPRGEREQTEGPERPTEGPQGRGGNVSQHAQGGRENLGAEQEEAVVGMLYGLADEDIRTQLEQKENAEELAALQEILRIQAGLDPATDAKMEDLNQQISESPLLQQAFESIRAKSEELRMQSEGQGAGAEEGQPEAVVEMLYGNIDDSIRAELEQKENAEELAVLQEILKIQAGLFDRDDPAIGAKVQDLTQKMNESPLLQRAFESIKAKNEELVKQREEQLLQQKEAAEQATLETEPKDPLELAKEEQERVEAAKAEAESERLLQEAREAMKASNEDPLDIDKRNEAAEKIALFKDHEAKHEADHMGAGDPVWAKLLKGVGIAFYVYVGLQYAMATGVENFGKGSGK